MNAPGSAQLPRAAVALALSTLALVACGAGGPSSARTDDDRYREIQRHEATIARSRSLVLEAEPACVPRCDAVAFAARAAQAICGLADEIADEDAQARCRRGRATVVELRARPAEGCVCDVEPRPGATPP